MWRCLSGLWRWWSSLPPDPPDGIIKISDSVYALRQPPGPPEIEIVFIHGLQLSDYSEAYWRTWIAGENDKDGREICWPMVWLGEETEFSRARILSLKYDSCVVRTNTTGTMDGFLLGESLVQEMVEMANIGQQKNCPVVFVCHSVGGLVAKEIVIKGHRKFGNNAKYVNFLRNIRGFHFYATPHDGSKLADLAAHLPCMGGMVDLVRVINKELGRLNDEFEHIEREHYTDKWQYSVVAETHITRCHGFSAMVVEEASARHGYEKFLSVGADHFGVCKPSDKASSSTYLAVRNFIASIVADNKVRKANLLEFPSYVVGMDSRVKEVCGRLEGHSVVALVGMGGVGKTTLSKYVFNAEKDDFERYCFLEDVKSHGNIEACQRQLFRDLCVGRWDESESVNFHLGKIEECITSKKVLLVVDDVGDEVNMRALQVAAFTDGKSGSKVIVTTRRRDIVTDFVKKGGIMDVNFLSEVQAFELFSYYAFSGVEESVRAEFDGQAKEITEACGELPLSLEVIGQFLRKYNSCESADKRRRIWDEALRRLRDAKPFDGSSDDKKLWARLKISFDDLSRDEQRMFLDMACILYRCSAFFKLWKDTLERIWDSPIGIENLTNRSLIKWSDGDTLVIHDQLRDMACRIVRDEVDGNKSRVWDLEEGLQPMLQKKVSTTLEGLFLSGDDKSLPKFVELQNDIVESLNTRVVQRFDQLRLLNISECGEGLVQYYIGTCTDELILVAVNMSDITTRSIEGLQYLRGLKVVKLCGCGMLETLPASIGNLCLLMELDVSGCNRLESLPESIGGLEKLQVLKLSWCGSLKTLPASIGNLCLLLELDLSYCYGLESLLESIGGLEKLQVLKLYGCRSLKSLPASIGNLCLLMELDLSHCEGLENLQGSVGGLQKLQVLKLSWCGSLKTLPASIGNLCLLMELDLCHCEGLESLPKSIGGLQKLQVLKLSWCHSLKALPASIGNLCLLMELDLSNCDGLVSLPGSVGGLEKLQVLKLSWCGSLKTLPTSIGNLCLLMELDLSHCEGLESLPESIGGLEKLQVLKLYGCGSLKALPVSIENICLLMELDLTHCNGLESLPQSIGRLQKLRVLKLFGCHSLKTLPASIGNLCLLMDLDLCDCHGLESLPESIGGLEKLQVLKLSWCDSLKTLPASIGNLCLLMEFDLSCCEGLESLLESIGGLQKLQVLKLSWCHSLKTLPASISNLCLLMELDISGCYCLESLPKSIGGLQKLQVLKLSWCHSLKTLPASISNLCLLMELDVSGCNCLESLPENIGGLEKLQVLKLSSCGSLKTLPASIGNLCLLLELDLSYCNGLESLPESIGGLKKLQILKLSWCGSLKTLPASIGNLCLLMMLDLSCCDGLESLPLSIGWLQKLQLLKSS